MVVPAPQCLCFDNTQHQQLTDVSEQSRGYVCGGADPPVTACRGSAVMTGSEMVSH